MKCRPSWGLDSAWLLHFFVCVGVAEKMLPPVPLRSGHRIAHPAAREERIGKAAPPQTLRSLGSAPACCHSTWASVSAHALLLLHPRQHCRGKQKALSVKSRKSKDVNAPQESGHISLFTKKTPGMEQGDLSVVSGLARDRGCGEAKEGRAMPRPRSSPAQCFWECRGSGVRGKCCR